MKLKDLIDLDLDVLLPLCREKGIYQLTIGGISISIDSKVHGIMQDMAGQAEEKEELQPCGHPIWASNEGLCLYGCLLTDKAEENN